MILNADAFAAFLREVHDVAGPFPWQKELCRTILAGHGWPDVVDVPTSLGKTSVLDVALFAMAAGGAERLPRRVFLCIDRRSVVDQAYRHASKVAQALDHARPGTVTHEVGQRLHDLTGGAGVPMEVTRMRGGVTWEWRWLRRPDQPAIVVGTIDQLGSRMFFRGYGVGERLYPIDAALVGTDSLFLLDEAHLAEPFLATLRETARFDQSVLPVGRPTIVSLSATPRSQPRPARTLAFDAEAHLAHTVAAQRLTAPKTAHLLRCPPGEAVAVMAAVATTMAAKPSVQTVGAIVNTVGRARALFDQLRARMPGRVALLTGRNRALDRARLETTWLPRFAAGRSREEGDQPYILVATQTVEVGMNLDFDALVTEAAAWDALVQRVGRLNRLGTSPAHCHAVIVATDKPDQDVVYGAAADAAANWIAERVGETAVRGRTAAKALAFDHGLDVSPLALRKMTSTVPSAAHTVAPMAPLLAPGVLDTWARTAPVPDPDVPVAPFLHGLGRDTTTVQIAWRADLTLDAAQPNAEASAHAVLPPTAEEILELPLSIVRTWLAGTPTVQALSDVEGLEEPDTDAAVRGGRSALRIRAGDEAGWVTPNRLRPGDTIVVPASYGGLDEWGWAAGSTDLVLDVADLAQRGNQHILRLDRRVILSHFSQPAHDDVEAVLKVLRDALGDAEAVDLRAAGRLAASEIATIATTHDIDARYLDLLQAAAARGQVHAVFDDALWLRVPNVSAATRRPYANLDDQNSPAAGKQVSLDQHHAAVATTAATYAANLGLDQSIQEAVWMAAAWHDLGKLDPRFQVMLHRGNRIAAAAADEPLAKSGMDPADRSAFRRAQIASGYPAGSRHELLSSRLAQTILADNPAEGLDVDLVLHLIAAHHGRSRPLIESAHDADPPRVVVSINGRHIDQFADSGVDWAAPARFHDLQLRYGRWGLALLETLVRLADISCSENGT